MTPGRRGRALPSIYLFPAVVGGGWGDIEEVLAVGRQLVARGHRVRYYRSAGHPPPRGLPGPWRWPPCDRPRRPGPPGTPALTVTPSWGLSAAPEEGGPWAQEVREIEAVHGAKRTLHVSLEEFARTLTSREAEAERRREGGVPRRSIRTGPSFGRLARFFHREYARYRGFDRPRVLHLFPTFRPDRAFAREFGSVVMTGPIPADPPDAPRPSRTSSRERRWLWYASPSSAERLAPRVRAGLAEARPRVRLRVVTPRPWGSPEGIDLLPGPLPGPRWREEWDRAELRIVTGSRTLLEAMADGRPFLYFNGIRGEGRRVRRHRPEKIARLLEAARDQGVAADLRRDLSDFARGRRIEEVVRRAHRREGGWARFPDRWGVARFPAPFGDPAELIDRIARGLAREPEAARWVAWARAAAPGRRRGSRAEGDASRGAPAKSNENAFRSRSWPA
ncbi:MAG: hypothetical protein ACYCPN_03025 [Thermoplasmata archaeon]